MRAKQKRALFFLGVTAAVYGMLQYLLPLVLPFFFAYGLARLAWPAVSRLNRRFRIPEGAAAAAVLAAYMLAAGAVCAGLGLLAAGQLAELTAEIPQWMQRGRKVLEKAASFAEQVGMDREWLLANAEKWIAGMKEQELQAVGEQLVPALISAGNLFTLSAFVAMSALFYIKERTKIRDWMNQSMFRREIRLITGRLGGLGRAFFRTQGVIFLLVAAICTIGLFLLGNRYFILVGLLTAVIDMLPVFGTGTVLIPWILYSALTGSFRYAAGLLVIYLLCYYLREYLEAHMMGKQLGISSLEMMIAMYAGLKLFGLTGLFLGPVGWILIKEIDKTLYLGYN